MVAENNYVITCSDVKPYFHESVARALSNQRIETSDETTVYVVNLLAQFTRSDQLFKVVDGHVKSELLALLYLDAVNEANDRQRNQILRRLGDIALFVSGFFPGSFKKKIIDVDYFVAMGGNAYGFLSQTVEGKPDGEILGPVFGELSNRVCGICRCHR